MTNTEIETVKDILTQHPELRAKIIAFKKDAPQMQFTNVELGAYLSKVIDPFKLGNKKPIIKDIFLSIFRKTKLHTELWGTIKGK